MTTKPTKARKFRIKRNSPAAPASTEEAAQPQQVAQGEGRAADQLRQSAQASTQLAKSQAHSKWPVKPTSMLFGAKA
jgi:hypothetical protein